MSANHPGQTTARFAGSLSLVMIFPPFYCLIYCPPVRIKNTTDKVANASAEKPVFQPRASLDGRVPFRLDMSNTSVAKGDVVIESAQPDDMASAARVGSTGRTGNVPRMLPKNTAIIIGLTPRKEKGTMIKDMRVKQKFGHGKSVYQHRHKLYGYHLRPSG